MLYLKCIFDDNLKTDKMLFDNIVLDKNSWHFKFLTWMYNEKPTFNNFCPYFWLTVGSILFVWIKLLVILIENIHTAYSKLTDIIKVNRFIKKVNKVFVDDGHHPRFYYYNEFDTFRTLYRPPAPYSRWTQLLILQYCMAKKGIKVFIDTVPEEIMLLDQSKIYYHTEEIEKYYTEEYKAYLLKIQRKSGIRKTQVKESYEPDALDRLINRINKFIGTINLPTKNTLIIGTKTFFKYLFYVLIPVILVAAVYGLYNLVLYMAANIAVLQYAAFILICAVIAVGIAAGLLKLIILFFKTHTFDMSRFDMSRFSGLLSPFKKIGKFFKVLYLSAKTVFSFFAAGFMLWKADNCPSITWTDELNTEENA